MLKVQNSDEEGKGKLQGRERKVKQMQGVERKAIQDKNARNLMASVGTVRTTFSDERANKRCSSSGGQYVQRWS